MRPSWIKWLWFVLFLIIFIPLLFLGIKGIKKHKKEKEEKQKSEIQNKSKTESNLPQYHYTYITVNFSGKYGKIVYLPSGSMAAFLDATEPYCSINRNNHEECGEKGQDISTKMGDTDANTELRFKSSSGKNGTLKIRVRDK